jgi:phage-related tail protein
MVPILRNKNGLAYDVSFKTYPPEVVEVFSKMVPFFNKFRNDNDIDNLSKNIDDLVLRSIKYKLDSFTHVNNEITMNKSIISIIIRDRKTKQLYRVWDYGNGI